MIELGCDADFLEESLTAYRQYYRRRLSYLNRYGCYHVPPTMPRQLHFAVPDCVPDGVSKRLASDLVGHLQRWTGIKTLSWEITRYADIDGASKQFGEKLPGAVC